MSTSIPHTCLSVSCTQNTQEFIFALCSSARLTVDLYSCDHTWDSAFSALCLQFVLRPPGCLFYSWSGNSFASPRTFDYIRASDPLILPPPLSSSSKLTFSDCLFCLLVSVSLTPLNALSSCLKGSDDEGLLLPSRVWGRLWTQWDVPSSPLCHKHLWFKRWKCKCRINWYKDNKGVGIWWCCNISFQIEGQWIVVELIDK